MNKLVAATGLALVLIAPALAATSMIQPNQMRAEKIIGTAVYDRQNQDVASVKDLILDKDGKVDSVVLSYGSTVGIGGKYVAVKFSNLKFDNNRLTLDQTKEQLASLPSFQLEDENTGAGEGAVPPSGGHASSAQ